MSITRISATSSYGQSIGSSSVVRAGNLIVLAGINAVLSDGTVTGGVSPYEQTRACLAKALHALSDVGAAAADVIQTRLYLSDAADWRAVGRAHREAFAPARPTATIVVVTLVDARALVEVELLACVGPTTPE